MSLANSFPRQEADEEEEEDDDDDEHDVEEGEESGGGASGRLVWERDGWWGAAVCLALSCARVLACVGWV